MSPDPDGLVLHVHAYDAIAECRGRSASEVGRRSGLSSSTLSRLRTSNRGASEATAESIAAALEVEAAAIFPQLAGWTPPEVTL